MIVTVDTLARPVTTDTFTDITTKECLGVRWVDGQLEVQFAVNLTADEARAVRFRLLSADADGEQLLQQAWQAYQTNTAFLALPAPTTLQALAQVQTLTRQMQGVLRLVAPIVAAS